MQAPASGKKKDALHLVVIGPPGAGKGSQCRRLAEQYNLEHISCGELMRHQKAMGTMLGQYLDDHWQLHKLSAIATDLVVHTIKKAQASGKGFVLDGSPRTTREAEMLALAFTANGIGLDGVIELVVSEEVATRRLLARRVHQPSGRIYNLDTCPPQKSGFDDVTGEELTQRSDDLTAQGIEVRFRAYDAYGAQVHSFFEKPESGVPLYFKVDANVDDLDVVHAELQRVVAPLVDINSKRSVFNLVRGGGDEDKADLDDRDSEKASTTGMAGGQRVGAADSAVILQQIKVLVRSSKPASRFPGSHPVALTSKNIKQLLDDDYRVAPKIDGERRFLALLDERLYLIDRRMRVELFPAIRFPARYNRTIFDGEIVAVDQPPTTAEGKNESESENDNESESESETTRRWYYVIFDVVCAEGEYVCHMPLHERLNLAKPVIESVEAAPFELTFQDYHPLDRIHAVFRQQRLHNVGGGQGDEMAGKSEKEKSDEDDDGEEDDGDDNASFFPTDGLLFVPVYTPYRLGYCERMMKWKPPAQNTIDFTLRSVTADVRRDGHPAQEAKSEYESEGDASQGESDIAFVKAADGADSNAEAEAQDRTGDAEADAAPDQRRYWQLFVLRDSNNYVFYDWIELSDDDDDEEKNEDKGKSESEGKSESDVVRRHGLDADNCIIECHWDPAKKIVHPPPASLLNVWGHGWSSGKGGWRFHRVRKDKTTPNAEWVVRNIEESIWDNLEEADIGVFVDQNATTIRRLIEEGPRFVRSRSGSRSGSVGSRHHYHSSGGSRRGSSDSGSGSGGSRRGSNDSGSGSGSGGAGGQRYHSSVEHKRREREEREERWERGSSRERTADHTGARHGAGGGSYQRNNYGSPRGYNSRDYHHHSNSGGNGNGNGNGGGYRNRSASAPNEGSDDAGAAPRQLEKSESYPGGYGTGGDGQRRDNGDSGSYGRYHHSGNYRRGGGGRGNEEGGERRASSQWGAARSGYQQQSGSGEAADGGRWSDRGTNHNNRSGGGGGRGERESFSAAAAPKAKAKPTKKAAAGENKSGKGSEQGTDGWTVVGRKK